MTDSLTAHFIGETSDLKIMTYYNAATKPLLHLCQTRTQLQAQMTKKNRCCKFEVFSDTIIGGAFLLIPRTIKRRVTDCILWQYLSKFYLPLSLGDVIIG